MAKDSLLLIDGSRLIARCTSLRQRRHMPMRYPDFRVLNKVFDDNHEKVIFAPAISDSDHDIRLWDSLKHTGFNVQKIKAPDLLEQHLTNSENAVFIRNMSLHLAFYAARNMDSYDEIVIVSDQYPLRRPMIELNNAGVRPVLSFFFSLLDGRWQNVIDRNKMEFFNLDVYSKEILGVPTTFENAETGA